MRPLLCAMAVILTTSLIVLPAAAQQTNPQQERMKVCNKQAGDQKLTGDARKAFMSDCLSGKTTSSTTLTPQQQKMKDCNATATVQNLTGDARKSFMSSCLKGS